MHFVALTLAIMKKEIFSSPNIQERVHTVIYQKLKEGSI